MTVFPIDRGVRIYSATAFHLCIIKCVYTERLGARNCRLSWKPIIPGVVNASLIITRTMRVYTWWCSVMKLIVRASWKKKYSTLLYAWEMKFLSRIFFLHYLYLCILAERKHTKAHHRKSSRELARVRIFPWIVKVIYPAPFFHSVFFVDKNKVDLGSE